METMETQGQQEDSDRLGRLAIQILALLGGLAGLLIAAFDLLASLVGLSSSHIPSGWSELGLAGGVVFLLLGLAGIGGAFLYTRNKKRAAWLLLGSGLLGFPVGYIAWIRFLWLSGMGPVDSSGSAAHSRRAPGLDYSSSDSGPCSVRAARLQIVQIGNLSIRHYSWA